MLADLQAAFRAALLDRTRPLPEGLMPHSADGPERRYRVHRDNVLASLVEALQSRFPVAVRITGDAFFREMAARFVERSPPHSPVLLSYGDDLPSFAETFEPVRELPYLGDVMRLEAAFTEAFHAADAESATAAMLAALVPEALSRTRVTLHPSVRLARSTHPIVTIWAMHQEGCEVRPIADWCGEDALVSRPSLDVRVVRLPSGRFEFLDALRAGLPLGTAVDAGFAAAADFDPAAALAGLVSTGSAIRFQP